MKGLGGERVLKTIILVLQIVCAVIMTSTILLQSGKSAGLSGSIAGGSEALFGKRKGLDEMLSRVTAWVAGAFVILTLALSLI